MKGVGTVYVNKNLFVIGQLQTIAEDAIQETWPIGARLYERYKLALDMLGVIYEGHWMKCLFTREQERRNCRWFLQGKSIEDVAFMNNDCGVSEAEFVLSDANNRLFADFGYMAALLEAGETTRAYMEFNNYLKGVV
ncbi:hypothetical protein [Paenibacillus macquariensis]|uniref:Uncharacterized protein n=1 Tax=Paenibacillus macquariensis TaxID=948756 RepID=A0ABY1KDM1_9BACL|nr:hypothetical protein [Paenibacillus macquariensis]OAB27368.1 hypothetical protein PMSM_25485 [Paenibacillus macquariensis subsp. macquariensis]SIR66283.1 hypothetical protein SAMN05421578_12919 [Paenibacillus macquariensis]